MTINNKQYSVIQIRRGSSAEFSSSDPVLASGEPGFAVDTNVLKIGNGVTAWSSLNAVGGGATISNAGDNRILTSDGTSAGINGESNLTFDGTNLNVTGSGNFSQDLFVNGTIVSVSGHTHTASSITDFDEQVDDRVAQLLVEGTGVNLTYTDVSGLLTIDNLHTEINELSKEPQGFVNRNDSVISFNDSTRTFTIQPTGASYDIYVEGIKVTKTGVETVVVGTGTNLNHLHFDINPPHNLHNKTTEFNFDTDVPIAYIHWNGGISQSTFFGEERHGIRMDSSTHKWIHNTFGIQYIEGLSIGGYTLLGNGSSNSHAQIDISDGTLYQEDIIIDVTNGVGTGIFVQQLSPIAYIPTYYHSGITGQWVRDVATAFPIKYNGTRAQYNLLSGGTWTIPNVTNGRYFATWIVATNDINDPILAIVGQREDSSLNSAISSNTWSDIDLTYIPAQELKPLYRLIFTTSNSYTNTPKSSLQHILDLRVTVQSAAGSGVVQNDHGSLFGLADDDHAQYMHINNARTIDAVHTFTNGLTSNGLITSTSGNFTTLQVGGTNVSVSGHTHTSSNITDFTEAVQDVVGATGFLVGASGITISYNDAGNALTIASSGGGATISNAANNRVLTSDGTSTGINGESNLTFDGTKLDISQNDGILRIGDSSSNAGTGPRLELNSIYSSSSGSAYLGFSFYNNKTYLQHGRASVGGIELRSANGSARLYVQDVNGFVGINTSTPSYTMHVVGSGYFNGFLDVDNLRLDANTISSTNSNGNIVLAPNGTGDVQVDADTLRVGDSNAAATITTNGTGNLTINTNAGTNSGSIVINQGSNGNIAITPNGTGEVDLSKVDIDGGSIDGTAIGANSASTGKFTQLYPTVVSNGNVSGSVATDVSAGQIFDMTVTGSTTLSNPTNSVDGVTVRWRIRQDGTGGHSVALGSDFQIPSSASSPLPWSTAANAMDILAATYHAGRAKWDVVAFVPGY